ncbi:MAG: hypothetical protein QXV84_05380 [Conexivisphaerales archaeon]
MSKDGWSVAPTTFGFLSLLTRQAWPHNLIWPTVEVTTVITMVKLQKHKAYTYMAGDGKEIEHYKYLFTVPEGAVDKLGWSA